MYFIKDVKEILKFGDIEKRKFHYFKYPIGIYNVDIDKILISNKIYFYKKGFSYFVGYKDHNKVKPLHKMLPKMCGYAKRFGEIHVFFNKRWTVKKYNEIWNKVSNGIKKGFASKPMYKEKYLKTKISWK